jgi:hypothetical protein
LAAALRAKMGWAELQRGRKGGAAQYAVAAFVLQNARIPDMDKVSISIDE